MTLSRRSILAGAAAGGALLAAPGLRNAAAGKATKKRGKEMKLENSSFYKADGTFNDVAAKEAYYAMMASHNYPIPDRLRGDDFWTLDFALGKFTEVGMAGIFWINHTEHNYCGHEIFLLPGQMIPEHWHLATDAAGPKLEGWHVRHGFINIYGEGVPTPGVDARIPESHKKCAVARTEKLLKPGETASLAKAGEKHWMRAGPEGAIVSEYATLHDMAGLRFSHPDVAL